MQIDRHLEQRFSLVRVISYCTALWAVAYLVMTQSLAIQESRAAVAPAGSQIVEDLVVANRILANEGVLDGLGHVSVRHDQRPDRFFLSRDLAPLLVTAADLMEFDLDGNPVDRQGRRMYQERFIHAAIYKARPDVKSVVHAHTPSVIVFADSSVPLRPTHNQAAFLVGGVPVFEIREVEGATGMLVNDHRTGTALAQRLGDRPVALMRGHGFVVVGRNIPEAVSRAIFLDVNARVQAQAIALGGTVKYLGPEDLVPPASAPPATSAQPVAVVYPRSWEFWKQRAMGK
jgi:ribulose-5-phosphate 4-epimerase/fuculose-1-phosphate aldolase